MRRLFLSLLTAVSLAAGAAAATLTADQREASVKYVQGLQNEDGGFRAAGLSGPSTLGSTSSALRALKYFKGPKANSNRFLLGLVDASGGLQDTPGGDCTVRTTAAGLMAAVELNNRIKNDVGSSIRDYFARNASTLPDIYIAAAALDAAGLKSDKASAWIAQYEAIKNQDGTYGKDPAEHAGAVITLLRLGAQPAIPHVSIKALAAEQLPDGGWAAKGDKSDLSSTYRVMRALRMLKARPDLPKVTGFIQSCRNSDGGYGPQPGQPSAIGPTYFASITLSWIEEMSAK